MVIDKESYNKLSMENKNNYIKIMIDGREMYFEKNSLIITSDKFEKVKYAQQYYEQYKTTINTKYSSKNVIKYLPKGFLSTYLQNVDECKKIRGLKFLSDNQYKTLDKNFLKKILNGINNM